MPRIAFGPQVCGRIDEGAVREWLVPDGTRVHVHRACVPEPQLRWECRQGV